ncbi:LPS assembly lipoprotein LptE [Acetobacteraceae bacterium ESL0709]|nr:LPS assembly lipoprotein LptE [Acetobacteraceae bacterium ESL0697]MDF7678711.1 LPS assembly lipoprotein LptE [Acetobacteraceae bacterium ESL0709]
MIKFRLPSSFKHYGVLAGLGLALVGLQGCGFHPLYGDKPSESVGVEASNELKRVYVENIPTRFGQTMRLALQKEMAGDGSVQPDGYTLKVDGTASFEAVDIHLDNTSGRSRVIGRANWKLYSVGDEPKLLAQGFARTLDGYDPTIQQYFAQTLNDETVMKRVSETLAHDITQQVAIWFKAHIAPGTTKEPKRGQYIDTDEIQDDHSGRFRHLDSDGFPAMATGRVKRDYSTDDWYDQQP